MKTKDMVLVGMFAAILAVISQISIPMPSGVPITIQLFGVALVGTVLGWKRGFLTTLVYILLGAVGLPVFSNFRGGMSVILGYTGGYILAWPVMVLLCGIRPAFSDEKKNTAAMIIFAVTGLMIVETVGAWQWAMLAGDRTFGSIMIYSFVAFIPKDVILTVLAVMIGAQVRKPLAAAGDLQ